MHPQWLTGKASCDLLLAQGLAAGLLGSRRAHGQLHGLLPVEGRVCAVTGALGPFVDFIPVLAVGHRGRVRHACTRQDATQRQNTRRLTVKCEEAMSSILLGGREGDTTLAKPHGNGRHRRTSAPNFQNKKNKQKRQSSRGKPKEGMR